MQRKQRRGLASHTVCEMREPDALTRQHTMSGLARLAVRGVLFAASAELVDLKAVWGITLVFTRNVVALFAVGARHRDFWTNVA